uniref:Uncharacterized protein n=1 Tax=Steinernema glaseri TaxID=37863 RepID=A0A1I8AN69_9BILA
MAHFWSQSFQGFLSQQFDHGVDEVERHVVHRCTTTWLTLRTLLPKSPICLDSPQGDSLVKQRRIKTHRSQ